MVTVWLPPLLLNNSGLTFSLIKGWKAPFHPVITPGSAFFIRLLSLFLTVVGLTCIQLLTRLFFSPDRKTWR